MNIAGTEINLKHRALEIYLAGCKGPHCEGCHNRELWDFGVGKNWEDALPDIENKIEDLKNSRLVDNIWVLGGEPLDHDNCDLMCFLATIKLSRLPITLWTHYEKVPRFVELLCDYAKLGAYKADEKSYVEPVLGVTLANRGQRVIKLRD